MKGINALMIFMLTLTMGAPLALAQGGAVYVSPKVMLSIQNIDAGGYNLHRYYPDYRKFMDGDKNNTGFGAGLAAGYDFGIHYSTPIRLEAEFVARTKAEVNLKDSMLGMTGKGNFSLWTQTLFLNAYYDIPSENIWHPYVNAGIGMAHHDARATTRTSGYNPVMDTANSYKFSDRNSAWNFAWNVGAGISYPLETGIDLDFGYRYSDFGDVTMKMVNTATGARVQNTIESSAHEIMLGLRFTGF